MTDLVERLRTGMGGLGINDLCQEAADEIERLRNTIIMADNRLEGALLGDDICRDCIEVARSYLLESQEAPR